LDDPSCGRTSYEGGARAAHGRRRGPQGSIGDAADWPTCIARSLDFTFTLHPTGGRVKDGRYDRQVTETTATLDQQLEEIRAQLAWVRDYL